MERIGLGIEQAVLGVQQAWLRWQDRRVGREVAHKREEVVQTRRKKVEKAEPAPLRIEPAVVAVTEVRAGGEGAPADPVPGCGRGRDPAGGTARSGQRWRGAAFALEFTSRLIETQARRLRRRGQGARRLPRPGDHALRDRAGDRASRAARSSTWPRTWRAPCRWCRSAWSRPCRASPAWRWNCPTRSGRSCACRRSSARRPTTACIRRSPWRWARTSAASRWWPTWPRCRTCWWPAPPARASRSASTP
jgi:hypothetical protein